jgi:hypothetical protein
MSETNLDTRDISIPFTPDSIDSDWSIPYQRFIYETFTLPYGLDLTELYLTMKIVAPDAQNLAFRLGIGTLSASYDADIALTEEALIKSHRFITGQDAKFTILAGQELFLDGLSILRAVNNNRKDDAFVLFIDFDDEPDFSVTGSIEKWLHGSAILGVL